MSGVGAIGVARRDGISTGAGDGISTGAGNEAPDDAAAGV